MRPPLLAYFLMLLALLVCSPLHAAVQKLETSWYDPVRQRSIPLKAYLPEGKAPAPTILFSHGLGGSRDAAVEWVSYWAEHGFTVLVLQHPGSDASVWQDKPAKDRRANLRHAATAHQLLERLRDVSFVIDYLVEHRQDAIASRVDLLRLGASGHSFGAVTTQGLAGERYPMVGLRFADPRPLAFLAFSPSLRNDREKRHSQMKRPMLLITGTDDQDPLHAERTPADRAALLDHLPPGDKYRLVLDGADHAFLGGQQRGKVNGDATAQRKLVQEASLQFWRAYLLNDTQAQQWLKQATPGTTRQLNASWASR
ncbi:alpha/beta hydrolase family protein [Chitinimonas sp. JJ19]|uniref:alpha/beta hydrolase family protein n=1 Tax=Chitinimonas sp. JJ19 TaxID=3109352 RepID=UPI003003906B